jgi:hypothetical protein
MLEDELDRFFQFVDIWIGYLMAQYLLCVVHAWLMRIVQGALVGRQLLWVYSCRVGIEKNSLYLTSLEYCCV